MKTIIEKQVKNLSISVIKIINGKEKIVQTVVYPRTAIQNVMRILKRLEKEGFVESLSVQRNVMNLEKEGVCVSFRVLKYMI